MKRILFLSIIFAFLVLPCFAQQSKPVSDADYAQVIKLILSDLRLDEKYFLPDEERLSVRLSTENIKPSVIPKEMNGVKIVARNAKQIEDDKKNNRRHYAFGKFNFNDSDVSVVLFFFAKNYESQPLIEGSVEYNYFKTNGNWKFLSKKPNVKVEKID